MQTGCRELPQFGKFRNVKIRQDNYISEGEILPIEVREQYPGRNVVLIDLAIQQDGTGLIEIDGEGNTIEIASAFVCNNLHVKTSGLNIVRIGENCVLNGLGVYLFAPGRVEIGKYVSFNGHTRILMHESSNISIGARCLIAANCIFSTSHIHKIFDTKSGERINPPGDVVLEDHVWCAEGVSCWGGSHVSRDSVVGQGTNISKKYFPPNSLIVGVPARLQREGINWEA